MYENCVWLCSKIGLNFLRLFIKINWFSYYKVAKASAIQKHTVSRTANTTLAIGDDKAVLIIFLATTNYAESFFDINVVVVSWFPCTILDSKATYFYFFSFYFCLSQ